MTGSLGTRPHGESDTEQRENSGDRFGRTGSTSPPVYLDGSGNSQKGISLVPNRFDWLQFLALLVLLAGLVFVLRFEHLLRWS